MIDIAKTPARVAIVGAGLAGLAAGARLVEAGLRPVLFEKSRGVGGRIATRRDGDGAGFDHGAQFVTARGAGFQRYLETAATVGAAAVWRPIQNSDDADRRRYVGAPRMRSLVEPLATAFENGGGRIVYETEVEAVRQEGAAWRLAIKGRSDAGEGPFDAVILAAPAPQAARLAASEADVAAALEAVETAPCWALMCATDSCRSDAPDVVETPDAPIAWLVREASKPDRAEDERVRWVAHASAEWSASNLELDKEEAAAEMLKLLRSSTPGFDAIVHAVAHRWRFARTTRPLGAPCLVAAARGLALCGDWCLGARAEAAFDSGDAAAAAILSELRAQS